MTRLMKPRTKNEGIEDVEMCQMLSLLFYEGLQIVGECSGLVSCPAEIREGARGTTWRHQDQQEGGYSPLCTPQTPIQHRPE